MTDAQATADWLAKLPARPPTLDLTADEVARYHLSEDATLAPGTWSVSDGMTSPELWGFIVRAHPSVVRATRVRWPDLDDATRAYALMVLVEDAP